ncbi:MAG: hypothetical protein ACK518_00985 [bacterium]
MLKYLENNLQGNESSKEEFDVLISLNVRFEHPGLDDSMWRFLLSTTTFQK